MQSVPRSEYHVASLLVHRDPQQAEQVRRGIDSLAGADLHVEYGNRLIVTVEGPDEATVGRLMTAVHMLDGVMSAVMIFQHAAPLDDIPADEEGAPSHAA